MCGIFCLLSPSPSRCEGDNKMVHEQLKRRGPDFSQDLAVRGSCYQCLFSAHVLHMRGPLTPQPIQDDNGNVLEWNGEIFGGLSVTPWENDTAVFSRRPSSCSSPSEILSVLAAMQGPWGFVYYQKDGDYLWFGRDFFGRRSLLWTFDSEAKALTLTSVAGPSSGPVQSSWQEVPAAGVYRIDLKAFAEAGSVTFEIYPWVYRGSDTFIPELFNKTEICSDSHFSSLTAERDESGLFCPASVTLSPTAALLGRETPPRRQTGARGHAEATAEGFQHVMQGPLDCSRWARWDETPGLPECWYLALP